MGHSSSEGTYALVADLGLEIEDVELEALTHAFSPGFTRLTTTVTLRGHGFEGTGEDVTPFEPAHQGASQLAAEATLRGSFTLAGFSRHLDELDLYPAAELPPLSPRTFRRWAFESAALDLALRQAGASLSAILRRDSRPVRFVNSPLLGADPMGVVSRRLAVQPALRFNARSLPGMDGRCRVDARGPARST